MSNNMENQLLQVTQAIEKQVDATIEKIDNLDINDLEQLRKSRVKEMQKQEERKREWLKNDHGKYDEQPEEKSFFDIIKKSDNLIIHFYTNSSERCQIVDKHLKILAPKHLEARFTKMNAEKCPFLAERLRIKTIPTIALIQRTLLIDKIVGFTDLGNRDDFTTETLEWRIAQCHLIEYEGDLDAPPDEINGKLPKGYGKKIRDSMYRDEDDLDIEEYGLKSDNLKSEMPAQSAELTPEEMAELGLTD